MWENNMTDTITLPWTAGFKHFFGIDGHLIRTQIRRLTSRCSIKNAKKQQWHEYQLGKHM